MSEGSPTTRLVELVKRFPQAHIWVAGDLMLDEYHVGSVERISPEAPVQVVNVAESFLRLGGAANAARSASALEARVRLCGVVGADEAGRRIVEACESRGIDATCVARVEGRPTTRKTRILGPRQQLMRLDWESTEPCPPEVSRALIADLAAGPPPTAVILSDYKKGFLTAESIAALIEAADGAPVLVDPKGRDFSIYRGATLLKPNLRELEDAAGCTLQGASENDLVEVVRRLIDDHDFQSVILTLSERGMLVVPRDGNAELIPARPRQVYDVTGAGDTAVAVLAVALSAGTDLAAAAKIANVAAGIVVDEVGATAVDLEQLTAELRSRRRFKAYPRFALGERVAAWRRQGKRIVFTNGCFDLLHAGHLWLLNQAADHGDVLVVGINSDASVARLKGAGRPLVSESDRTAMLAALEFVDAVVVFDEDTPLELIEHVKPDVLVKGADYQAHEVARSHQAQLALIPGPYCPSLRSYR